MKKLSLFLALLMVATMLLASCGGGKQPSVTTPGGSTPSSGSTPVSSSSPTGTTTPKATIPEDVETSSVGGGDIVLDETTVNPGITTTPSLAETVDKVVAGEIKELPERDYDSKEVNVLLRREWAYEFTEGSGDPLLDEAIYNMVADVEDEFNVRFVFIDEPGGWGSRNAFVSRIHNSVLAEDNAYDMVFGYQAYMIDNIANGDFRNLLDLPYLQLGQDWWTQQGIDSLTLNKKCYMATGDIFLSMWRALYSVYFNKDIATENGINDIYQLVSDNKWTHDKMEEYTMKVSEDLNNDDIFDTNDKFGLVSGGVSLREFLVAYNTPVLSINGADIQVAWNTERTVTVVEELVGMFKTDSALNVANRADYLNIFKNGNALFMLDRLEAATDLRASDVDFGIIPYPMLDEAQGAYYTSTGNDCSMVCVPITVRDADMSALLIEALCRKGSEYVEPAFYETALKGRYVDEESAETIDIIRDGLRFDFGWVHSVALNLGNSYQLFIDEQNTDFASYYESRIDEYNTNIKTIRGMYFD